MTFDDISKWQLLILYGWNFFLAIVLLWLNAKFVSKVDYDEQKTTQETVNSDHNNRLTTVEVMLKHFPTEDQIKDLSLQIARVEGDMKGAVERFRAIDGILERVETAQSRVEDFLLRAGK
ncbi:MAG: hypothetical protein DI551_05245 [Micavibrio aeruginosavorus]|uniref:DUF2730 domain-containing protein n=1 Tax=Micavibrio aeruginosavorus TaxID=349221 RepID=A0A2W5MYI0_9BACT|nr:MAG: hypothetical protein DI551_05245 [Micavibrio aeruginosavorus]